MAGSSNLIDLKYRKYWRDQQQPPTSASGRQLPYTGRQKSAKNRAPDAYLPKWHMKKTFHQLFIDSLTKTRGQIYEQSSKRERVIYWLSLAVVFAIIVAIWLSA